MGAFFCIVLPIILLIINLFFIIWHLVIKRKHKLFSILSIINAVVLITILIIVITFDVHRFSEYFLRNEIRRSIAYLFVLSMCAFGSTLVAIALFIVSFFKKEKDKEKKIPIPNHVPQVGERLAYAEYTRGAIELLEDRLIIYTNIFPFVFARRGRIKRVVMLCDISSVGYKGFGFFPGLFFINFIRYNKPLCILTCRWLPWNGHLLNPHLEYIVSVIEQHLKENHSR